MALIQVTVVEEVLTLEQKRRVIENLTDAMLQITGEAMRGATWVTIQNVRFGACGIGGQVLTKDSVKALKAGKAAA
jgi:4-oxalocrotonate tautomerase